MKPLSPEILVKETVDLLRADQTRKGYNGCLCLLSAGPGKDGKGAPGLGSAVTLRLLMEAFGKEKVMAVTYVLDSAKPEDFSKYIGITFPSVDFVNPNTKEPWEAVRGILGGYHRLDWVEATSKFARQLGIMHSSHRMTGYALSHCWYLLRETGTDRHPADVASNLRSILAREMANQYNKQVASGYNLVTRMLFEGDKLEDSGDIAPVMNFDRSTLIAIGRYLGLEENILQAPPSNGAQSMTKHNLAYTDKFGANRYYTKFFKEIGLTVSDWKSELVQVVDQAFYNARTGLPLNQGLESVTDERVLEGIKRIAACYHKNHDKDDCVALSVEQVDELRK
ncbi:MAG: hypothetical protein WCV90_06180 [Candidatus Woesearchaeota archaeon]|jgi:NH3-dependent NAD+ synthetase